MKGLAVAAILLIAGVLYVFGLKLINRLSAFDERTDRKWFGIPLEDYENDRRCVIAGMTVAFVMIAGGLVYLVLTQW